jgi:hypothetical protein
MKQNSLILFSVGLLLLCAAFLAVSERSEVVSS